MRTKHQNTAEEPKDHLAAPRDLTETQQTQHSSGNHTFPQKYLSYRTETMVTKGMECNSWEVQIELIFSRTK